MTQLIIDQGGEIHFEHTLTDVIVENGRVMQIEINNSKKIETSAVVLATGHSARDIYQLLFDRKIKIEAKPFALGVRVEHTQEFIDKIQYHGRSNDE